MHKNPTNITTADTMIQPFGPALVIAEVISVSSELSEFAM